MNVTRCVPGGWHIGNSAHQTKGAKLLNMRNLFIFSCLLALAGCSDDSGATGESSVPENTAELCADGLDNDNNGVKDCDEDSCKAFDNCKSDEKQCPASMPKGKKDCTCDKTTGTWTNCQDMGPSDKECPTDMPDGKKDCTCDYATGEWKDCHDVNETKEICDNEIDDDGDGDADCADSDCDEAEQCMPTVKCPDIKPFCAGSTYAYCEGTELKTENCEFGCGDSKCNSCEEANGEGTCEDNGTISMRSYCSDNALVTEDCPLGCEGNHCLACVEGAERCSADGISLETCKKVDGVTQWVAEKCPKGCANDQCFGCAEPGSKCVNGNIEICNNDHEIEVMECELGCEKDTKCRHCYDGMRTCEGKTVMICEADRYINSGIVCPQACSNGYCEPDENGNHMKDEFDGDWMNAAFCNKH